METTVRQQHLDRVRAAREVRRALGEAYGFLQGVESVGFYQSYSLSRAVEDRLGELEGKPRNAAKPNRLDRISRMLDTIDRTVEQALLLEETELGDETVNGISSSFLSLGGMTGGVL